MLSPERKNPFIIAGPCAAESRSQVCSAASSIKERNIPGFRAGLWKPRTQPGFEGVGEIGIPWLREVAERGLIVAAEAMTPKNVVSLAQGLKEKSKLIVWLGSRNQNHLIQREIALAIKEDSPLDTLLMIKNQPWEDKKHWLGIVEHIVDGAHFPADRILLCHRGFSPNGRGNPCGFRNIPRFELAMKVQEETKMPMLFDPSHVGGSVERVFEATRQAIKHDFDGFLIEVHPNPTSAKTDRNQQLNIPQFDKWLTLVKNTSLAGNKTKL